MDEIEAGVQDGNMTPRQGMFRLRAVMNGDEDQLEEFARLVAAQVQTSAPAPAQADTPGGGVAGPETPGAEPGFNIEQAQEFLSSLDGSEEQNRKAVAKWAKERGMTVEELLAAMADNERQMMLKATNPQKGTYKDEFGAMHYPGGPPSGLSPEDMAPFGLPPSKAQ